MGLVKRKSSGNLIEMAQNEIEFKRDKASKIIDKNSTSKLLSKSALKKTNKKLMQWQDHKIHQMQEYKPLHSVIDENISEINLLHSFDERLHKSI